MSQPHNENYNEQPMTRMGRIQQPSRRYRRLRHPSFTAAIWTANNPLLQRGEIGSEIDTGKLKIGDGVTYWNDLGYVAASEIAFADITGTPDDNVALKNALDAKQDVLTEGTGIDIDSDNVISNTGVRSVATGTTNGTISVNTGGTSAEVAVYGLGSAAYTSSSDYATKDLSNLTSTGANIGNWSSNVTNCITEIPQDIKLELNNGTLTLKAGSKVYVPNGAGVFDAKTVSEDKTVTSTTNGSYFAFTNANVSALTYVLVSNTCSGSTDALAGIPYHCWYNTANNTIIFYSSDGTTAAGTRCLPIALFTVSGGQISSIDQVFNGFGYIGSTVFVLPGVKGLIPYYRNSDGTLKNTVATSSSVNVYTPTSIINGHRYSLAFNGTLIPFYNNLSYNEAENRNYAGGSQTAWADIGYVYFADGKVSQFFVKQVFRALDYDDSEYIANQAMPGNKYIDLTFSHGMTPTAPADGYFVLAGYVSSATLSNNGGIVNQTTGVGCTNVPTNDSSANSRWTLPVKKGDTVQMYLYGGTATLCRFVFANGTK